MNRSVLVSLCAVAAVSCGGGAVKTAVGVLEPQPQSLDFGTIAFGASADQTFVVRNTGGTDVAFLRASVVGDAAGDFSLPGALFSSVAVGDEAIVTVRFTGRAERLRVARVVIETDSSITPSLVIPVSGVVSPCECPAVMCKRVTQCLGAGQCAYEVVPGCAAEDAGATDAGAPDAGAPDAGAPDAGTPDAGMPDAGAPDAGAPDAGTPDAGAPDAGMPDAGMLDAGTPDAGAPDAGRPDAGLPDAGRPDAGPVDAGAPDAGPADAGAPDSGQVDAGPPDAGAPDAGQPDAGPFIAKLLDVALDHVCTVIADGGVKCWGENMSSQLGTLDTRVVEGATSVQQLQGPAIAVGVSAYASCAILADRRVSCWGTDSTVLPPSATPVIQPLDAGAWDVAGGSFVNCAITGPQRSVYCWGTNSGGAYVGNGSTSGSVSTPVLVPLDAGARKLAAGSYHECALLVDGRLFCWGKNFYGQLFDGRSTDSPRPVQAIVDAGLIDVTASDNVTCALRSDGRTICSGDANFDFAPLPPMASVAVAGRYSVLGVSPAGVATCQPGFSFGVACARMTSTSLVTLDAGVPVRELRATSNAACALQADAGVLCWGSNAFGVVGVRPDAGTLIYTLSRPVGL